MTTYIGSHEAARLLGVSPATLYAYVSRGRITRRTAADGRSSLFPLDAVQALADRSRRAPRGPRPSIDVRITSAITTLHEDAVTIRGHDLGGLVPAHRFEDVAELLWTSTLPPAPTTWPRLGRVDRDVLAPVADMTQVDPVNRLAIAAHLLAAHHPDDDGPAAARRLLTCTPHVLGSRRATGSCARRLAACWSSSPGVALVDAIDTSLAVLADHELATSTLAVRVAASVRPSPYAAIAAGLATVQGTLHGSASNAAHRFLERCAASTPEDEIARIRSRGERIPGFGHKVYRGLDPRFGVLLDAVRPVAATSPHGAGDLALVDRVVAEVGRVIPKHPNVDLALGALTWIAGLDPDVPIFAIARIAGWGAHFAEELGEAPVRYRGIAG